MRTNRRFTVGFRRKREGKTNYKNRLKLLLGGKPRLVVRCSSKHVAARIIEFEAVGDKVLASAHTANLKKLGWKGNCGNICAAYLVGLMIAKRAIKANVTEAVLDIGMQTSVGGSRLYAVLKGALDGGLKIKHSKDVLPENDRIMGKHISNYAKMLKEKDGERYNKLFSAYLKNGLNPEDLTSHFEVIKKKVEEK
ncbi:MAG: 50S ribosomal protein L18 [Candidatus Woesearchaeota archaeon]